MSVFGLTLQRCLMLCVVVTVTVEAFVPWQDWLDGWLAGKNVIVQRDVAFWHEGRQKLTLDLARPNGSGPFPAVIFVHGGGWRAEGNAFRGEIFPAARQGYVAARIHYRLLDTQNGRTTHPFPTQLQDVQAALGWLRDNSAQLAIDPNRIALVGMSAGGQLALLAGFHSVSSDSDGPAVRAIVNFYGPTDLLDGYRRHQEARSLLEMFLSGTPSEVPENYADASPITFVRKGNPPVLTLHGDLDMIVPVEQAKLLDERMKAVGASHTLIVLPGEKHGFTSKGTQQARRMMYEFLGDKLQADGSVTTTVQSSYGSSQGGSVTLGSIAN